MSTRSLISIVNKDGSLDTIYCHYDGYLSDNGLVLYENYQTVDKIRGLLSFGDIKSLSEELDNIIPLPNGDPESVHYEDMKDYLDCNLKGVIAYHYFYNENKKKWSVGFHNDDNRYVNKDLLQELKARYCWEHKTDKFCCIVVNGFKQKTNTYFLYFLQKDEPKYHDKMHDMIYSDYFSETEESNGNLVIYFEPEKFQKNIPVIQELLDKYELEYSITLVTQEGIKHLGTYEESREKVKEVLSEHGADCPIYNVIAELEESPSFSL